MEFLNHFIIKVFDGLDYIITYLVERDTNTYGELMGYCKFCEGFNKI